MKKKKIQRKSKYSENNSKQKEIAPILFIYQNKGYFLFFFFVT